MRRSSSSSLKLAAWPLCCAPVVLCGCALSISPLAKHANAFSSATITVANGAQNAYTEAMQLHDNEQLSLAVIDYDRKPAWNPADYVKPLLTDQQLLARTTVLDGLKTYAQNISNLTAAKRNPALEADAASTAAGLQALSRTAQTSFATSIPDLPALSTTETNALSAALVGLSDFLSRRQVEKSLPSVLAKNDGYIAEICKDLKADIVVLRRQADVDYGRLEDAQDQYIRHANPPLSAEERRREIARLPQMVRDQQMNDELLTKLQSALTSLALTHHALAAAAQGNNPEGLQQYIADLSAEGQDLAAYYQTLAAKSAK